MARWPVLTTLRRVGESDYAWAFIRDGGEEKFFGAKCRPRIPLRRDPLMVVGVVIDNFAPAPCEACHHSFLG
jgi:hypothetical protein